MKLPLRNHSGVTESLAEFYLRAFPREEGSPAPVSIPLYSGVPVLNGGPKKRPKPGHAGGVMRGKVIT